MNNETTDTLEVTWDRGMIWHRDCAKNKWNSGVMTEVSYDDENKRTVVECLHCGRKGYLPNGANGRGRIEEIQAD